MVIAEEEKDNLQTTVLKEKNGQNFRTIYLHNVFL